MNTYRRLPIRYVQSLVNKLQSRPDHDTKPVRIGAMRSLAAYYRALAENLDKRAARLESEMRAEHYLSAVGDMAEIARIDMQAARDIAARIGCPEVALEHHRQEATKRARARETRARNREIVRLARSGLTNQEIARQFGLHPITISRIIRREWAASH